MFAFFKVQPHHLKEIVVKLFSNKLSNNPTVITTYDYKLRND